MSVVGRHVLYFVIAGKKSLAHIHIMIKLLLIVMTSIMLITSISPS